MSVNLEANKTSIVSGQTKRVDAPNSKSKGTSNTSTTHSEQNGEETISTDPSRVGLVKKAATNCQFDQIFDDDFLFELLLDYFTLNDIYLTFSQLNRRYNQRVEEANYLLLRKLTDKLHISSSYLTSDLPVHNRIVDVYRNAVRTIDEEKPVDLKPNAFTTDSGLVGTNMWYGMHNIFEVANSQYSYYVFSSNKGENNHIQTYLCNPGTYDSQFSQKMKSEYEKEPGSKHIYVPYEKIPQDGGLPTFKVPKVFEINCRNQGYCYYTDNLALFFSESEIEHDKFNKISKHFNSFKSVSEVEISSKMPILKVDKSEKGFTIIEFDLSKKNEMAEAMGLANASKLVSVPLIYINIDKNLAYGKTLKYQIIQNVAAKYMSMKLICCASYPSQTQLDMFPCSLKGISLDF